MVVAQLRLSNPHVFLSLPVWKTRPRLSRPHSILLLLLLLRLSFFFSPFFLLFPLPASPSLLAFPAQAFSSTARSLFFFTFVLPPDEAFLPQGFPFAGASSSLRSLRCFRERFIRGRLRGSVEYTSAL